MNAPQSEITPLLGTSMGGGFYAGRISIAGVVYALIVAPKAEGQREGVEWNSDYDEVDGALSFNDGLANTKAMAEAGSKLAKWAIDLRIGGNDDWYIPSLDELEVIYRNLKPGTEENSQWYRSGINLNSVPPTQPYTAISPAQTEAELFKTDAEQAFDERWYWTSTQDASDSGYAWCQDFGDGDQLCSYKNSLCRARAVRRLPI